MKPTSSGLPHPDYFILASTSPRRRQFLKTLGVPFTVIAPGTASGLSEIDETPLPGELPDDLVQRLSFEKAKTVVDNLAMLFPHTATYKRLVVIAADTSVVLNDKILGKPANAKEAIETLKALRQQPHFVYSGLTVARPSQNGAITSATRLHKSKVLMRPYSNAEIDAYVATGSPLDKAGAYGIQDQNFAPVAKLEGCFAGIMGLPLGEMNAALREIGLSLLQIAPLCSKLTGANCCQA